MNAIKNLMSFFTEASKISWIDTCVWGGGGGGGWKVMGGHGVAIE